MPSSSSGSKQSANRVSTCSSSNCSPVEYINDNINHSNINRRYIKIGDLSKRLILQCSRVLSYFSFKKCQLNSKLITSKIFFSTTTLTKWQEGMLQFSQKHGAILGFVVQFQTFNEIFVATLVLILLNLCVDGEEFFQADFLLIALLGAAQFLDQRQGWVQVESTEGIT